MKNTGFYNLPAYQEKQAEITRKNWQRGLYDFLRKREKRQCANPECGKWFEVKPAETKKFCSRKCAAQINNSKRSNIPLNAKEKLIKLYQRGFSMQEISNKTGWKYGRVVYLMKKFNIPRRNHSESAYVKWNRKGDPFCIKQNLTPEEQRLLGIGLGLYLGEGNKNRKTSVRISNSDPKILKLFREFLIKICGIRKKKLKYQLLLFNDANKQEAINFWMRELTLNPDQISSITSLKPRGKGSYKKKSMTGVLILEFNNIKLRREIEKMIEAIL